MTTFRHPTESPEASTCRHHGPLEEAIVWLKGLGKWVLTLVGACAVILLMTFGAVLKFGMDMSAANKEMQQQIVFLTRDVTDLKGKTGELEKVDKQLCADMEKLKRSAKPYGGVKGELDHPAWSE